MRFFASRRNRGGGEGRKRALSSVNIYRAIVFNLQLTMGLILSHEWACPLIFDCYEIFNNKRIMNLMFTLLSPLTKITVYRLYLFNHMAFSFIIVGFAAILEFCKFVLLEENRESSRLHRESSRLHRESSRLHRVSSRLHRESSRLHRENVRFDRKLRVPRPNRKRLTVCINRYSLPITECLYSAETL